MTHNQTLSLFTAEELQIKKVPKYCIKLVTEAQVFYDGKKISGASDIADFLKTTGLHEKAQEEFYAIYLNTKNKIIGFEMVSRGTLNASLVHPRDVFKGALLANAHAIILAHNHPSGDTEPSHADKSVTETLVKAGQLMNVEVLDHVIIGSNGSFFSFRDHSLIN